VGPKKILFKIFSSEKLNENYKTSDDEEQPNPLGEPRAKQSLDGEYPKMPSFTNLN